MKTKVKSIIFFSTTVLLLVIALFNRVALVDAACGGYFNCVDDHDDGTCGPSYTRLACSGAYENACMDPDCECEIGGVTCFYRPEAADPTPVPGTPGTVTDYVNIPVQVYYDTNGSGGIDTNGSDQVVRASTLPNCISSNQRTINGIYVGATGKLNQTYHAGCTSSGAPATWVNNPNQWDGYIWINVPIEYEVYASDGWTHANGSSCTSVGANLVDCSAVRGYYNSVKFGIRPVSLNCSSITGPDQIQLGSSGNFTASYHSSGGLIRKGMFYDNISPSSPTYDVNSIPSSTSWFWNDPYDSNTTDGTMTQNWVPTAAGTYNVCCRATYHNYQECRPDSYVDPAPGNQISCVGPNVCKQVIVSPPPVPVAPNPTVVFNCAGTNPGQGNVTLTWTAPANATAYQVNWCSTAGCTPWSSTNLTPTPIATTTFVHTNRPHGSINRYQVRARNSAGTWGAWSTVDEVTVSCPCTCTVNSLTPLLPISMTVGQNQQFEATVSTNAECSSVSQVAFTTTPSGVVSMNPTPVFSSPYRSTANALVGGSTTLTARATAVQTLTSTSDTCSRSGVITVAQPTADLIVQVYQTNETTAAGCLANQTSDFVSGNPPITLNPGSTQNGSQVTFYGLQDRGVIPDYTLAVGLPSPNSSYVCGTTTPSYASLNGPTRSLNLPATPSSPITAKFWFTTVAPAWFQVIKGDAGAIGSITASIPSGQYFLGPWGPLDVSSGVSLAGTNVGVSGPGNFAPALRLWQAEGMSFPTTPASWYGYFTTNFGQLPTPVSIPTSVTLDSLLSIPEWMPLDDGSWVLVVEGNLTLIPGGSIPLGEKRTVFVSESLTVNSTDIDVPTSSFLGFVVSQNITFGAATRTINGVYIADGVLRVNNATTQMGSLRQFVGKGIFVGMDGVVLERNLNSSDVSDDLANNENPGVKFEYRGDFLVNAPEGFKHAPVTWNEVLPE